MFYRTTRFGEIEYREETALYFPEGLIGFENYHNFIILGSNSESMFCWLQSLDDPDLAFVIICPYDFKKDYNLELEEKDVKFLEISDSCETVVYCIVVIPENPERMTANLQAPLVINSNTRRCRQIISGNNSHRLRHSIIDEMKKSEGHGGESC